MSYLLLYVCFVVLAAGVYLRRKRRTERRNSSELKEAIAAGLADPPSLHPVVDLAVCLGSGACAKACPEQAMGIVNGKAVLKNGSACIGHGACRLSCPVGAITLVFGTDRRGIDIPHVKPDFESNVPGIFIAGELGGMGLIRKAAEQGRQAMDAIARRGKGPGEFDVVIVGCGPAGISAGLSAVARKLRYKLLEQEASLGGAVFHYPRNKVAMTAPVELDLVGKVKFGEVQKEELLEFWMDVVARTGLQVSFSDQMIEIVNCGDHFVVKTARGSYTTRSVLLTMGRRGTPRKLEVPGEESAKVVYRLMDPAQYAGKSVLVVGGGDSALEAAIAVSRQPGAAVTLSYRSGAFSRVKPKNRQALESRQAAGGIRVMLNSTVRSIGNDSVDLETEEGVQTCPNDAVIVCAGGMLPTPLLQRIGIKFETKFGQA